MWHLCGFWWIFPLLFFVMMIVGMVACLWRCGGGRGCCGFKRVARLK